MIILNWLRELGKRFNMKVLIFGNILVEGDNFALKLIPGLKSKFEDVEFKEFDPTEDLQAEGRDLLIIDAVVGIDSVRELVLKSEKDFEKVELNGGVGMHDFDLGYELKLRKEMGEIADVKIIGIPMDGDKGGIITNLKTMLS